MYILEFYVPIPNNYVLIYSMKKMKSLLKIACFCVLVVCFFCSCRQPEPDLCLDYSQKENWLIFDDQTKQDALFDVFYVYPSLYSGKERLMPVRDSKVREKALDFAVAQTGIFHGKCRVFAPLVRQAEYKRVIESMKQEPMPVEMLEEGNADTMAALQYYLRNENHGRPFVLLGHSQGSMNLYCALKEMLEISPEKGFVAAYFAGLPGITEEKINRDFAERDIVPGKNPDDIGFFFV